MCLFIFPDKDECLMANSCPKNSHCINREPGYGCVCAKGYVKFGLECVGMWNNHRFLLSDITFVFLSCTSETRARIIIMPLHLFSGHSFHYPKYLLLSHIINHPHSVSVYIQNNWYSVLVSENTCRKIWICRTSVSL